jgi:putative flippase GtrA
MNSIKIKFIIIGGFNTIVGLATFPILYLLLAHWSLHYLSILIISQFICINISFVMNKRFVFDTRGQYLYEYLKFLPFHLGTAVLNLICLPILVEFLFINPMIAQLIFSGVVIISSYVWYSKIVFLKK